MSKKYLLYVDILGFENLANEIAIEIGSSPDHVRQHILSESFVRTIEEGKNEYYYSHQGTDDYIIIFDSLEDLFTNLRRIVNIKIDQIKYDLIPIEAAIDIIDIDKDSLVEIKNTSNFISSLKSKIIEKYREHYKTQNQNKSVKDTFIVSTKKFNSSLEFYESEDWVPVGSDSIFMITKKRIDIIGRLFEFLNKASLPQTYRRIDKLYINPTNYDLMKDKLRKNKILFITGTQETGKTYSAIRLMWENFLEGYDVKYFPRINKDLTSTISHNLSNISDHLKPHTVIYFEDPYGRIEYVVNENLERNFATIVSQIKNNEDTFVIITSRTEVFKKFRLKKIGEMNFDEINVNFNLKTSYNIQQRERLLMEWAKAAGCKWLHFPDLVKHLIKLLESEKNLPTPLNIHDFCVASSRVTDIKSLDYLVGQKSKETSNSFADEFRTMEDDKMVFLSFLFVSNWFSIAFIKTNYEKIVNKMGIEYWSFQNMLKWFEDHQDKITKGNTIKFSHPSYSQTLEYLLKDPVINSKFKKVFNKILSELSLIHESRDQVLRVIAENFDLLEAHERDILLDDSKGKFLLLHYTIIKDKDTKLDINTKNALGKEGQFLFYSLSSTDSINQALELFDELVNWTLITDYIAYIEKRTEINYSTLLLRTICKILETRNEKVHKKFELFFKKLVSQHIDNLIKSAVLVSSRAEQDFINIVKNEDLVKRVIDLGLDVSEKLMKRRIASLQTKRFLRYDYPNYQRYKAGARLALTYYTSERKTNEDRVFDHIKEMITVFGFPEDVVTKIYDIHTKLHHYYLSTTHEPKRIASGIIYLSCKSNYHGDYSYRLHKRFGVNPTTTRKLAREILHHVDENSI